MDKWWEECLGLVACVGELSDGGLLFEAGGERFEVAASGAETHTEYGAHGMTVYADLDGDGVVDQVSTMGYDGAYQVFQRESEVDFPDSPANRGWGELVDTPHASPARNSHIATPDEGSLLEGGELTAGGWACVEWG